jgi:hypothetical protein
MFSLYIYFIPQTFILKNAYRQNNKKKQKWLETHFNDCAKSRIQIIEGGQWVTVNKICFKALSLHSQNKFWNVLVLVHLLKPP